MNLLPCKKCSTHPQMHIGVMGNYFHYCYGCGLSTGVGYHSEFVYSENDAVTKWNKLNSSSPEEPETGIAEPGKKE